MKRSLFSVSVLLGTCLSGFWVYASEIQSIGTPSELLKEDKHGDLYVFDIDKTVLRRSKKDNHILSLDLNLPELVNGYEKNRLFNEENKEKTWNYPQALFLTARGGNFESTQSHLTSIGFSKTIPILSAPDKDGKPTKGKVLAEYLLSNDQLPKRIIFIDDLKENLEDVQQVFKNDEILKDIQLKLCLKKTNYKLYDSTDFTKDLPELKGEFPENLDNLTYVKHLSGGSGGVHILKDEDGNLFTLKCDQNPDHMKEEILADALHQALGVRVPPFAVYDAIPKVLQEKLGSNDVGPYRLASYIDSSKISDQEKCVSALQKNFVSLAFLSNWDAVVNGFKNGVLDTFGCYWFVDNGGSLRYSAVGFRKMIKKGEWNPYTLSDLETLRDENKNREGALYFKDLTEDQIQSQAQTLFSRRDSLLQTFETVAEKIHLSDAHEVKEMLLRRFDDLANRFNLQRSLKNKTNLALCHEEAKKETAAGILVYTWHEDKLYVLLGKRVNHNWWGNFGGHSELKDQTLTKTAKREVEEESLGLFPYTSLQLDQYPFHDLMSDNLRYRMYIAPHSPIPVEEFKNRLNKTENESSKEYTDFEWIPLSAILTTLNEGDAIKEENQETKVCQWQEREFILHPPFVRMLQEVPVMKLLTRLQHGKKIWKTQTQNLSRKKVPYLNTDQIINDFTKTVILKGEVLSELKGQNKKSGPSIADKYQMTPTLACLSDVMGDDFKECNVNPSTLVQTFLKKYAKFKGLEKDESYTKALTLALQTEMKYPKWVPFYHGVDPFITFLYDIYTQFRLRLDHSLSKKTTIFRGMDGAFRDIKDVEEFIQEYTKEDGKIDNYETVKDVHYADRGISANPWIFGSDGVDTSATYYLFHESKSVRVPDYANVFNAFMSKLGIPALFKDYEKIFNSYLQNKNNTRLFQILINPKYVDQVAYLALSLGKLLNIDTNGKSYHGFQKIHDLLINGKIDLFKEMVKNSGVTLNELQARIYLKPDFLHNEDIVQVNSFWRHSINEKGYWNALSSQVKQDLFNSLTEHTVIDQNAIYDGLPPLKRSYILAYKNVTGLKYQEQDDKEERLPAALMRGDLATIKRILEKNSNIDVNQEIPNYDYRDFDNKTVPLVDALQGDNQNAIEIIKLLMGKGLSSAYMLPIKAAKSGNLALLQYLLDEDLIDFSIKDDLKGNILHMAVIEGQAEVVKLILSYPKARQNLLKGENLKNCRGATPLHFAEDANMVEALLQDKEAEETFLKEDNLHCEMSGRTILHATKSAEIVKLLLGNTKWRQIFLDKKNFLTHYDYATPLHRVHSAEVAKALLEDEEVYQLILKNFISKWNDSPFIYIEDPEVVTVLLNDQEIRKKLFSDEKLIVKAFDTMISYDFKGLEALKIFTKDKQVLDILLQADLSKGLQEAERWRSSAGAIKWLLNHEKFRDILLKHNITVKNN
jgi:8-oxo-dGTP pyrophosphatase MutT (NUDIX family)/ankyrin repeat protein